MFRRRRSVPETDSDVAARMPPVTEPSKTEQYAELAREQRPANEHWTQTQVFSYLELLRDRSDSPLFVGVTGRPAVLLRLSGQLRANLDGLAERIEREGMLLYVQGHRLGRYGILRAVLELPEYELIFETPLTLAHGDVQEFLVAGYRAEAVEFHLAHSRDARVLSFGCRASGIRPVVDAALAGVQGLEHPTTPGEQAAPVTALEAKFPNISDGLDKRSRIRLSVNGSADSVVTVVTRN